MPAGGCISFFPAVAPKMKSAQICTQPQSLQVQANTLLKRLGFNAFTEPKKLSHLLNPLFLGRPFSNTICLCESRLLGWCERVVPHPRPCLQSKKCCLLRPVRPTHCDPILKAQTFGVLAHPLPSLRQIALDEWRLVFRIPPVRFRARRPFALRAPTCRMHAMITSRISSCLTRVFNKQNE